MSSIRILRALLIAHDPLAAILPTARIIAGDVPAGTPLPAIGMREVGHVEQDTVARGGSPLIKSRVQVTVYAGSLEQQEQILKAARLGVGVFTGVVEGFQVRSVLRDVVGPDMGDHAAKIFEKSRDFMVTYLDPS